MTSLPNGDLLLEDGTIIPASKRQPTEVYSRMAGGVQMTHTRFVPADFAAAGKEVQAERDADRLADARQKEAEG